MIKGVGQGDAPQLLLFAPPMVGRYGPGEAYLAAQGRVFVVFYAYGQAANWQDLQDMESLV